MGLYDRILFEAKCGVCGEKLTEWQTTDLDRPSMRSFRLPLPPKINRFYSVCYCGAETEYTREGYGRPWMGTVHAEFKDGPRKRHGHAVAYEPKKEKGW